MLGIFSFMQEAWFFAFIAGNITGGIILVFVLSRNPKLQRKLYGMRDDIGDQFKNEIRELKEKLDELIKKDKDGN